MLLSLQRTGKNEKGKRENNLHFTGVELPQNMDFTDSPDAVLASDVVLLARPSRHIYQSFFAISERLKQNRDATLVLLSKGFGNKSLLPLGVEMRNYLRATGLRNFAVMSGPTPALELVDPYRTSVASVASEERSVIEKLKGICRDSGLCLVGTQDVVGVSWGGCLKNAYAIGFGILSGFAAQERERVQELGSIAWCYLDIALREMEVFLDHAGARPAAVKSPAVKGDFRMTSEGTARWKSRNVRFGEFLAEYHKKEAIDEYVSKHTVEGYEAMKALFEIADTRELDVPLLYGIHSLCEFGASPETFIALAEKCARW
jgi:glycerol-3-phosphate dehydrogenase